MKKSPLRRLATKFLIYFLALSIAASPLSSVIPRTAAAGSPSPAASSAGTSPLTRLVSALSNFARQSASVPIGSDLVDGVPFNLYAAEKRSSSASAEPTTANLTVTKVVKADQASVLQSPDGKVSITFPVGAVSEDVRAEYTEITPRGSTGAKLLRVFELKGFAVNRADAAVNQFAKDLTITIQHTKDDFKGIDTDSFALYYLDESSRVWQPLKGQLDPQSLTLTATTNHFSYLGENANPAISGPGRAMDFQMDLHSGTAVARYPIELPPGPGSFQPKLNLTYSSGGADEMKNKRSLGSWVGIGWTLHPGRISYDEEKDKYYLEINGSGNELVYYAYPNEWRTKPDEFYKLMKGDPYVGWQMWDQEGNYYRFGYNSNAIQYWYDQATGNHYYHWDLSLVQDTKGNQMTIAYQQQFQNQSVRSAYPQDINYGNGHVNVHFNFSHDEYRQNDGYVRMDNPLSYGNNPAPKVMEDRKLDSIEVKVDSQLVRKYAFSYTTTDRQYSQEYGGIYYSGHHKLSSIAVMGADGTSQFPVTSLTYNNLEIYYNDSSNPGYQGNPGDPASLFWPHLTSVDNGYGATVSYTYTEIPATTYPYPADIWTREAVTQMVVDPDKTAGPGLASQETHNYSYTGNPQYYYPQGGNGWDAQYRGFGQVRETDAASNYADHWFYTTGTVNGKDAEKLTGREYKTEWRDSNNNLLKRADYDWNYTGNNTYWAHLDQADNTMGVRTACTRYTYDGYGNITTEYHGGDLSTNADDSTVWRAFYPSTDAWILSKTARERTYATIMTADSGGANLKEETLFRYDNQTWDSPPLKGNLTQVQRKNGAAYITSTLAYDTYGNRTSETDFKGNTTTTTFDSTYHTYPVTKTFPTVGGLSMYETYSWNYVGRKVTSETDVNGQTTSYEYDTFWRPTKVIRPGDSSASPTIEHQYNSWGTIGQQHLKTLTKVAAGDYLWRSRYFDGIGREVQTHARGETGRTIIEKTVVYNNRGLVDKEYVSQDLASSQVNGYYTPAAGWKATTQSYDGLARVTTQAKPDGATIGRNYGSWQEVVTNERSYKTLYDRDAFGRLGKVYEADFFQVDFVTKWGSYGSGQGQFNTPRGIAVDSNGNVYVVDSGNHRVQKFDANGNFLLQWGSYGTGDGQFQSPVGIAVDSSDNVYVADQNPKRVQKFDSSGNFLLKWALPTGRTPWGVATSTGCMYSCVYITYEWDSGGGIQRFTGNGGDQGSFGSDMPHPRGIAVDSAGYIYVADQAWQNPQVHKYDFSGNLITKWGAGGNGDAQFAQPNGVAVDDKGFVYVADSGNSRIQKFTSDGTFTMKWGSVGSGDGQFYALWGVATAPGGYIYTTDTSMSNASVQKFKLGTSPQVTPITDWGSQGSGQGQFNSPFGVAVDSLGNVYIADRLNHRIQKFDSSGNFITQWGSYGTGNGQFDTPWGIAVGYGDVIYVTDAGNHRVQKFDSNGNFLLKVDSPAGDGLRQIVVDKNGLSGETNTFFVADASNHRIYKAKDSGIVTSWGTQGTGDGQLQCPEGVGLDNTTGYIYVVEYCNNRVSKFDINGNFIAKWGSLGSGDGQLYQPTHVAVDSNGAVYVEDSANNRVQMFSGNGSFLAKFGTYGSAGGQLNLPWGIASDGGEFIYVTEAYNHRVQKFRVRPQGPTTYSYDVLGNLTQMVDAANNTTSITYDPLSRKTAMTDPDMGTWSYAYDDNGNLTSQTDAKSQTITFAYDSWNRLTGKTYPQGSGMTNVTFGYDDTSGGNYGKGRRTSMADAQGTATYQYDARGRLIQEGRPIEGTTYTTQFAYDAADRPTAVTYSTGETSTQTYNGRGLPYSLASSASGTLVSSALYNQLAQMTDLTLVNGVLTEYGYWDVGGAHDTTGGYYGRLWRINTYKGANTLQDLRHTWDASGNLAQRQNMASSDTESFTYDNLDRLTVADTGPTDGLLGYWRFNEGAGATAYDSSGSGNSGTLANGPAWVQGKLGQALSFDGADDYVDLGNKSQFNLTSGPLSIAAWVKFAPGAKSDPDTREHFVAKGRIGAGSPYTDLAYGFGGQWMETSNELVAFRIYHSTDSFSEVYYPYSDGFRSDAGNWHYYVTTWDGTTNANGMKLYVDGQLKKEATAASTVIQTSTLPLTIGFSQYGYLQGATDEVRLYTRALSPGEIGQLYTGYSESYAYSAIGNITARNGQSYSYGAKPHATLTAGATVPTYAYDANGNMTARSSQTLTWDAENRLTSVTQGGSTSTFTYAGEGQRLKKVDGGETTVYPNRYYEKNLTTGAETLYYYLGGKLIALKKGGTLTYMHQEHLGSSFAASDGAGAQTAGISYYPYGGTRGSTGSLNTDRKFTGQRFDGTGLYYYGARYYDAELGRFISPDTVIPKWTDPQAFNRYSYVRNNPLRYRDPSGHIWEMIADMVSIGLDIDELLSDPSWENASWLALDIVLALAPILPATGVIRAAGKAAHAATATERVAARTAAFAGAGEKIESGVTKLARLVESGAPARFRRGFEAQLQRAEHYFKAGKLDAVEFREGSNVLDLVLKDGTVVEVKHWTKEYAEKNIKDVVEQAKRYRAEGRDVILEFVETASDPIGDLGWLIGKLNDEGLELAEDNIHLIK